MSDLVVAEAVHHRSMGAAEVANAWLQVLSGGHVPGRPTFLKTVRTAQGSTHRVSVLLEPATPDASSPSPRAIAEPSLAATASAAMNQFSSARVSFTATRIDDPNAKVEIPLSLADDLLMSPIDLVVGGESELRALKEDDCKS